MNMNKIIEFVPSLIYTIFLLGLAVLQTDNILTIAGRIRLRHRLALKPEESSLSKRCSALLSAAFGKKIDGMWLIMTGIIIYISVFLVAYRNFNLPASIMMALLCASCPFLLLYTRVQKLRNKGSREGLSLVTNIYRLYRINGLNMQEAIESALASQTEIPVCSKHLYLLLIRLRDAASTKDVKECCRQFAFALGTVWGRMLAICIETACVRGIDVSAGLEDIVEQLKTAKALDEERKRMNAEALRMTLFLVPVLYFGSLLLSVRYLGISFKRFVHNQLFTTEGLLFMIVNIILFIVNIITLSLISNKRVDY